MFINHDKCNGGKFSRQRNQGVAVIFVIGDANGLSFCDSQFRSAINLMFCLGTFNVIRTVI